jgi:hypothetical protein
MMGLNVTTPGDDRKAVSGVVQPTTAIFSFGCASHLKGCNNFASRGTALALTLHTANRCVTCTTANGRGQEHRQDVKKGLSHAVPCRTSNSIMCCKIR